jgi:pimeloyl-ACP methyl ester carboxylesterase
MSIPVPLLLLPGSLCDEQLFRPQLDYFSSQRQVSVGCLAGSDSISGMAAQVLAKAPEKFAVAGLSMGGIVAFEIVRQAPTRVDRLALLDTNPGGEIADRAEVRRQQMDDVSKGGLPVILSLVESFFFPRYVAASRLGSAQLKATVLEMAKNAGVEAFIHQWQALMDRPDSCQTLAEIDCPTLVLCGDEDAMCSPDLHRDMAESINGATLEIINNCGHLSTLEAPNAVNTALDNWLHNPQGRSENDC